MLFTRRKELLAVSGGLAKYNIEFNIRHLSRCAFEYDPSLTNNNNNNHFYSIVVLVGK